MNNIKTLKKFREVFESWEVELKGYEFQTLLKKPNAESWSLGQVYIHLINSTLDFHLKQVQFCLENSENSEKSKNLKGFIVYKLLGSFPPIKIKVPASENYTPEQPESIEQIIEGFAKVRAKMELTLQKLTTEKQGKTKHPGFQYLNGNEWYRLVEMHFRHHKRQKERIDQYIKELQ
ncbi:MAG: DinB family protein [Bacteroidota bacterium]